MFALVYLAASRTNAGSELVEECIRSPNQCWTPCFRNLHRRRDDGYYYASCAFSNQTPRAVSLAGARDQPGEFHAKAVLFVSAAQDGPWRKVAAVAPAGRDATLVVRAHSNSKDIIIGLNKLVPLIEKFNYAKICLPTGEATIFSIKELKR